MLFWVSIKLSQEYKATISFPIEYANLPQDKLLEKQVEEILEIIVKGTGYNILSEKFSKKIIKLDAQSLQRKSVSKYFFLLKNQKIGIEGQLKSRLEIDSFLKDSIFVRLGYLTTKKVPIFPNVSIEFKQGYDLSKKITYSPDSISISGPKASIDSILKVDLEEKILTEVVSDISEKLNVVIPKGIPNLKLSSTTVLLEGIVEKFTEGSFEVPFKIQNLPTGVLINTFPKTVKVIFKVGLSNFNKINEDSFEVTCDYQVSELNNYTHLIPKVISKSALVKSVKVIPSEIDFLIQK
jgi:hypothetical protein